MGESHRRSNLSRYGDHADRFDELTPREIEVLELVARGFGNREIARRLRVSEETVKTHVRHLIAKLTARSRTEAVAIAFRRGLLH